MNDSILVWNTTTEIEALVVVLLMLVALFYFMGFFDGFINFFFKSKETKKVLKDELRDTFKIDRVQDIKLKRKIEKQYEEYLRARAYHMMMKKNMDTLLNEARAQGFDFLPDKKEFDK